MLVVFFFLDGQDGRQLTVKINLGCRSALGRSAWSEVGSLLALVLLAWRRSRQQRAAAWHSSSVRRRQISPEHQKASGVLSCVRARA